MIDTKTGIKVFANPLPHIRCSAGGNQVYGCELERIYLRENMGLIIILVSLMTILLLLLLLCEL